MMSISKKKFIFIGYFVVALILLLDCTNNFPGIFYLRKLKYVYIMILAVDFMTCRRKQITKISAVVMFFLFFHTLLFGIVFVNPDVLELTRIHCREMVIYLLFLMLMTNAVERYNCKLKFIEATCAAFAGFMLWCGITHISNFVNPMYFIYVFNRTDRVRSEFGTGSPNYMGYYCFIALVFFYALWYEYNETNRLTQKKKYGLLGISLWTILILLSTGSRSSILSFFLFATICIYQLYFRERLGKAKCLFVILAVGVALIFVYMNWTSIWGNANREANISINVPVFRQMNAFWKGMGYIESAGFYNDAYGYDTWPVDIYYLYIYLSTGIIGSLIIAIPLLYILYRLIRKKDNFTRYVMLSVYIAILFDGLWQVNIFTYRYIATLFIGVLLLITISLQDKRGLGEIRRNEKTK